MYELIAVAIIIVLLLVFWSRSGATKSAAEHMHSPWGNVGSADIDKLGAQHDIGATMDPTQFGDPNDPATQSLDNSDGIAQLIAGQGPDVFLPNGRGTTATSYGGRGGFAESEPSYNTPWMLPQTGTNADEMLARKQQHISSANKRATDGMIRHTAASFKKYFANEMAENERKDWWSAEADPVDSDYAPGL